MKKQKPVTGKRAALPEQAIWKPKRSVLVALLAVAVALAILCSVFGALLIAERVSENGKNETFRYDKTKIKNYIANFSAEMVTGYDNIPGKDVKPTGIDEAAVKAYIDSVLLENAKAVNGGRVSKSAVVGYADEVSLYVLEVLLDGKRVETDYFDTGFEAAAFQVGAALFGEDFDKKLMALEKAPKDMGTVAFRTVEKDGTPLSLKNIEKGTVLSVSYTATIDGETAPYENYSSMRLNTADPRNALLCEQLLAKSEVVGQQVEFELTHDIDGDGDEEKVAYKAVVAAVVEEKDVIEISFTLPADYFSENQDEEYTKLNGKTLTARIVVDYMVDYEARTWDTMTVEDMKTTGIGYVAAAANDAERQNCIVYVTKTLSKDYEDSVKQTKVALIWQTLLEELEFDALPEAAVEETYDRMYDTVIDVFHTQGYDTAYTDLNAFAVDYFGYSTEQYATLTDYLNEYFVPNYVKQELLIYGIYNELLRGTVEEKLQAAFDARVDELVASAGNGVTEQQVIDGYGEDYIRALAIGDVVEDYLFENNDVNWDLAPEIEE